MPFVFVLLFVVVFIVLVTASNRKLNERRTAMQAEIDSMRGQMQACVEQCRNLDEKTRERVGVAKESVEGKLLQASGLLRAAAKDRHFERVGRILALVQTKLGNVQASLGRAQTRVDERVQRQAANAQQRDADRVQRQADAAARRTGSFGQVSAAGTLRMGSFAPPAQVTDANTAWKTVPRNERGACFFCSRPCLMRELTPVVVPLGGTDRRVLACPADFASVKSGTIPPIRAFSDNGRPVPWYGYNRYDPYDDYYGGGGFIYIDTLPYGAFDPGYWNFNNGYANDNGPSYNFSPDSDAYQDYSSGLAAGAVLDGGNSGSADFQGAGNSDNVGSVDFEGMESASDFDAQSPGATAVGADLS
jgi:hypothetical protein